MRGQKVEIDEKHFAGYMHNDGFFAVSREGKPPLIITRCIAGEIVFSRTEFAQRIGVATLTLRKWERNKRLVPKYYDRDGTVFYTEEQAQQYFKAHQKWKHTDSRV